VFILVVFGVLGRRCCVTAYRLPALSYIIVAAVLYTIARLQSKRYTQFEEIPSVPSMDPGDPVQHCNLYFFLETSVGRPRISLPSGV
jgi:hypothetical protein